ncbi:hypothetical protein DQ240_20545 [Blastococcus sp. TF02A-26]|nr:hypothetical protein DQ240_20545 [Blastococcus sp. TF02A-26]
MRTHSMVPLGCTGLPSAPTPEPAAAGAVSTQEVLTVATAPDAQPHHRGGGVGHVAALPCGRRRATDDFVDSARRWSAC